MNHLLRPWIWSSFRASSGLTPCDVPFRYASDPSPCDCPVANPSPRPRYGNSCNMRARFTGNLSEDQTKCLARTFHESLAVTTDMAVLPGVLGCRLLRSTAQVRLGTNPEVPRDGCPVARPSSSRSLRSAQSRKRVPSCVVSRQQFMKYPG